LQVATTTAFSYTPGTTYIYNTVLTPTPTNSTLAVTYSTSTGIFTVNVAGIYSIDAQIRYANLSTSGQSIKSQLLYNGVAVLEQCTVSSAVANVANGNIQTSWLATEYPLNVGDTFSFQFPCFSATPVSIQATGAYGQSGGLCTVTLWGA
jgi:hypothetical protein